MPPARITSFLTETVWRAAAASLAYSTPVAVRFDEFEVSKRMRVTVAFGRIARFARGGRGSMYPEREYERVQFAGLSAELAMYAPAPFPLYASADTRTPRLPTVSVQFPTVGIMLCDTPSAGRGSGGGHRASGTHKPGYDAWMGPLDP